MNTGIYCIEHKESGKKYIGSAIDIAGRWRNHLSRLRKGDHHSPYLQHAWSKHGETAFEFRKILICSKENLLMYEQLCLDGYGAFNPNGYNAVPKAGSQLGMKHSEETKKKMSASSRHRRPTEAEIESFRKRMTGRTVSMETRRKLRNSCAKLTHCTPVTEKQVAEIFELRASTKLSQEKIGAMYGIQQATVSRILRGKYAPEPSIV